MSIITGLVSITFYNEHERIQNFFHGVGVREISMFAWEGGGGASRSTFDKLVLHYIIITYKGNNVNCTFS